MKTLASLVGAGVVGVSVGVLVGEVVGNFVGTSVGVLVGDSVYHFRHRYVSYV